MATPIDRRGGSMRSANYVEETTTSIAGTSGDGAITLTAITGIPRFSTVFGTQATTIRYVIEDTVNKKFETGVGSVASNVLTRTRPQTTWDGTTYDDDAPTALQFGATPTSGNVKIRISATAENTQNPMPQPQNVVAGDSWRDYPFCASLATNTGNGSGLALTASREYYLAYKLDRAGVLKGFQFEVTTAVAGTVKAALYSCGHDGFPSSKIVDFVATSCGTTGIKTDTATGSWSPSTPPYLTAGWYYIGFVCDVAASIRTNGAGNTAGAPTPLGRKDAYGYGHVVFVAGNHATGMPSVASLSGGTVLGNGAVSLFWMGLRVTP